MSSKLYNLEVFKESHKLVLTIYKLTKNFPEAEKFGIISQIRRAAYSVVSNIVEGNARGHKKEFIQFLYLSHGSLEEVKYFLLLSKDLGYISHEEYTTCFTQTETVGKLLTGLIKYWKNNSLKF